MTALSAALAYGEQGLPVFPCGANKKPLEKGGGGFKGATTDARQITEWWTRWPDALIGMPTGERFCVLDLDVNAKKGKNGLDVVTDWATRTPVIAQTQSGGRHLYFAPDVTLKSVADQIAPGVDTRGRGAYVIVPPSAGYSWVNGHDLSDLSLLPPWPDDLRPKDSRKCAEDNPFSHYATHAEALAKDQDELAYAVSVLPNNDMGWDDWNRFGLAIWAATGGTEQGYQLFDSLSQKSSKYDKYETRARWIHYPKSPPSKIGAGSIFHWADAAKPGWRKDYQAQHVDPTELDRMNERHCVVPVGGKARVATFGFDPEFPDYKYESIVRLSPLGDFKALQNKYRVAVSGGKTIGRGAWWLEHPDRRQYDGGVKFMPTHDQPVVGDTLNLWRGFAVKAVKPEGKSGAAGCSLFLAHALNVICSGDEAHYEYLINREAFIAQKRTRSEVALVLRSEEEGTGKGFYARTLNYLYGPHAMQVTKPDHVTGKHNRHLESLLRLTADEATFAGDPRHRNALYGLVTEPTLTIEPKNIDAYSAPNHINVDIITNAAHAVQTSGRGRRYFVPKVSSERAKDHEYFRLIDQQLRDGGYQALLFYLLHEVDVSDFSVREVPMTIGASEQAAYSRRGVDLLVETVCNERRVPCSLKDHPGFSESYPYGTINYADQWGFDWFIDHHPDRELKFMGPLTVKRRLAKDWGCLTGHAARIGQKSGIVWPDLRELRGRFEAKHGPQQWADPEAEAWERDA
jgi:Bifunctional DNA primase/polymerase, N-terminal/Primase C terminal 2 (PriCT-2)/Family of unknown function (DUF5906)